MSVCRKLPDGTIQKIAGHTILLDANASEIREGFFTIQGAAGTSVSKVVTFTDPMPDTDYVVIYEYQSWGGYPVNTEPSPVTCVNKTTTGFTASMWCFAAMSQALTIKYTAFKPIKLDGYTALRNKVNNPDDTPTIGSMNLVTSDGVARAIENASAVWKGTRAEWNALPATTKIKYDLAVITDGGLIKSVDRTTGDSDDVADLTKVWTGTQAEWDAMTQAQKDQWDKAMIQDGYYGITPAVLPVGCVQAYMGSVEPPGWLLCNGQTFDASVYPDLYNVLGINKVPDLRGEFLRGAGTGVNGFTGPAVKAHQAPTSFPLYAHSDQNGPLVYQTNKTWAYPGNMDGRTGPAANIGARPSSGSTSTYSVSEVTNAFYARPTNTGVNWIIFAGPAQ